MINVINRNKVITDWFYTLLTKLHPSHVFTSLLIQLRFCSPSLSSLSCVYPQLTHPFLLPPYLPSKIPIWLNAFFGCCCCHLRTYSQVAEYGWRKTIMLTGLTLTLQSLIPESPCSYMASLQHSLMHPSPILLHDHFTFPLSKNLQQVLSHSLTVNNVALDFTEKLKGIKTSKTLTYICQLLPCMGTQVHCLSSCYNGTAFCCPF